MLPYENLEVYKKAMLVNQKIYLFLKESESIAPFAKNQLGRASLSILLNIAEGSAKLSNKDRKNFFITARGSAFECSSLVSFLCGTGEVGAGLKEELCNIYEEISRMLYRMIKNLEMKEV